MTKKNKKNSAHVEPLVRRIEELVEGLVYASETDASFEALAGPTHETACVPPDDMGGPVEEILFDEFFAKLTKRQAWYGDKEIERAEQFLKLQEFLASNLTGLKVFRIGRIQVDIYVIGFDKKGDLVGVRTKTVET